SACIRRSCIAARSMPHVISTGAKKAPAFWRGLQASISGFVCCGRYINKAPRRRLGRDHRLHGLPPDQLRIMLGPRLRVAMRADVAHALAAPALSVCLPQGIKALLGLLRP